MIPILYEDENILAVDKPAGIASIPERQTGKECLSEQVAGQFGIKIFIVHRLDKEVSGVILFAKNPETHRYLNTQFSNHLVKKEYLALVHGLVSSDTGEIDQPIRTFGSGRMGVDLERGKECRTRYRVQQRYKNMTLVEVFPVTGRRHQIRVHFYSLGHSIVGDPMYGDKKVQHSFDRLMLHAHRIQFKPLSGPEIQLESPLPESFLNLLYKLNKT